MPSDGEVLVVAFFAVALKLFLWSKVDNSGLRLQAEAQPDVAEGIYATFPSSRLKGDRYV
jgi:hypothetical protein